MRIPYMKISQKNEVFFVTKFNVSELRNRINFHFREPYSNENNKKELYQDYIDKLRKKGIEINAEDEGVQRRIQINRINKIKNYLEEQDDSYFPTAVVLAADVSNDRKFEKNYDEIENNDFGYIELSDDVQFQIVDGQHRLAGLFISDQSIQDDFEISAVVLFNATTHTCAKVFADINGNQAPVNRSVIYDLYDLVKPNSEESYKIQVRHQLCKKFNSDPESPLYLHLKMLGVGNGAISQAFFVQYLGDLIDEADFSYNEMQDIYNNVFLYLKAFQRTFSDQWPVLEKVEYDNMNEFYLHSHYVLKIQKSQILKTNGFGALMMLFPLVYKKLKPRSYNDYFNIVNYLHGKIDWEKDDILIQGTGKKNQKKMRDKLIYLLNL